MEVEETVEEPGGDSRTGDVAIDLDGRQGPIQSIQAEGSTKISKCAYCRKDHKKCVRASDEVRCERCKTLKYSCFGGLETAILNSPKRGMNKKKCVYCRETKQKCLPVDRVWPNICERCMERNLSCSEPENARKRPRIDKGPSTNAASLQAGTYRYSQSVQPASTNYARLTEPTEPYVPMFPTSQSRPTVSGDGLPVAMEGVSDDSNLAVLSKAAVIYPKDNIPLSSFQSSSAYYAKTSGQWSRARARWHRAFHIIRRGVRIDNIASIFLYAPQPGGIALCNVCVNLGLSRESFIINSKDHHSQLKREPVYLQDRLWSATKQVETGRFPLEEVKLGNVGTIRGRGHICPFCRLVWDSAQDQVRSSEHEGIGTIIAYASWQIDGRQLLQGGPGKSFSAKPRNRCIRLHWSEEATENTHRRGGMLHDAFIILVADGKRSWDSNFLGRPIEIGKGITAICKDWVEQCQHHHPHSHEIIPKQQVNWSEAIGHRFRLLDVVQMRTFSPEETVPQYVALSYIWGREQKFYFRSTDVENFERLGERGRVKEVWNDLPRTIQDTIKLVEALEFRYLWVDVLCVTYDESSLNHRAMDQIYSNAFLTVCAADGGDSNAGLVALHERKPLIQHIERCAPGLELMVSHPSETYISKSVWNSRGWTFQERILSNRCLIFAANRVYWECRDATASEDIIEDSREPSWSINMLFNPLKVLGNLQDQSRAVRAYMRCVQAYTLRHFSCPDDVLIAFEGVGKAIGTSLMTDLLYGLPSSYLDLALLWEFNEAPSESRRRQSSNIGKFPSWSWCGWEGSIAYRSSTLSGTLSNIQAWISTHTWISWYVRDRYNIARLLHKSRQEPAMTPWPSITPKLESPTSTLKVEEPWMHDKTRLSPEPSEAVMQSHQQQPVKWPAQNRSMFFKSVPNLRFDTMDVEGGGPKDPEHRNSKYLQFWTWSGFFRLGDIPLSNSSNLGPGLSRFGILDCYDDFCGTIILPNRWVENRLVEKRMDRVYELVAISDAKDFTPEEFKGWTYYIPKERDESEWDMWYVLLVEKADEVVVRRVGLGKVFQEAFENSCSPGKEWREFIMA